MLFLHAWYGHLAEVIRSRQVVWVHSALAADEPTVGRQALVLGLTEEHLSFLCLSCVAYRLIDANTLPGSGATTKDSAHSFEPSMIEAHRRSRGVPHLVRWKDRRSRLRFELKRYATAVDPVFFLRRVDLVRADLMQSWRVDLHLVLAGPAYEFLAILENMK